MSFRKLVAVVVLALCPRLAVAQATLSAPSFAQQNTTGSNDMSADGYSWAAAKAPFVVDKFGKIIGLVSRQNAGTVAMLFVASNDNGATWLDPTRSGFASGAGETSITRGMQAYDSVNDKLHVLWDGTSPIDGIIYRRYAINRDGSNNITGLTKDATINLQLDFQSTGTMNYQHPNLMWIPEGGANGSLLALWGAQNTAGAPNKAEVRSSMRVLSNDVNDNTAANWTFPVTNDTTTIGNGPIVPFSAIDAGNYGDVPYPAFGRKAAGTNAKDVYVAYYDGNFGVSHGAWKIRRMRWNVGANKWTTGLSSIVTLSNVQVAGTDTGYAFKSQLGSQVAEDVTNDKMAFAYAIWKDNANGDTWSFQTIDNTDTASARVDVYSAGGAHVYAPVGDLIWDQTSGLYVVSYQKQDTFAYIKTYTSALAASQAETLAFNTARVDIPLVYPGRVNGKLLMAFRDSINTPTPPYHGWAGTMTWSSGVVTPTTYTGRYIGKEQIAVDATAGGVGFSASLTVPSTPLKATIAECRLRGAEVSYMLASGTTVTASVGMLWEVGETKRLYGADVLANFKAIRTGGTSGQLDCEYFAY